MAARIKRALKWFAIVVLALAAAVGGLWYSIFGHASPIVDGQMVAEGVEQVKDGFVSLFVVDAGPGKVVLIDAGNDKSGRALLAALGKRGLSPASVAAIFLTHGHPDHTAGCTLFPDAPVYALQAEVSLIGAAAKLTHTLKDGEVTSVGDLRVETFAVPGHTPGSAVYFARGVLFFGDSASATKDGQVAPPPRIFTKDPPQNVASLKALATRLQPRAADIQALAFAHSGPLPGLAPLAAFSSKN
jgi:glyoxylase-like metal-dependent hydrolase (beta-lactamase superfamily II)